MLLSQLRAYSDAVTAAEHHLLCTPMLHIPGLLVVSPAANSSCARIPRCRRLAYTCLDTHCQQVLRAKHLLTSAPTKTPIAHIIVERKHKITTAQRADKTLHLSENTKAPQQSDNRKQHHIKSKRQTHHSRAKIQKHHSMGNARRLKYEGCLRRCHAGITPHSAPRAWRLARRGEAFGMCPLLQSTGSPLLQSTGSPLLQSTPVRRWCVSVLQSTGSPLLQSTASPRCVQVVITIHP